MYNMHMHMHMHMYMCCPHPYRPRGMTRSLDDKLDEIAKKYDKDGNGKYDLNECVVRIGLHEQGPKF